MIKLFFLTLFVSLLSASYLTNKSCSECHEGIYEEYQSSYHSKSYFNDELHRKVAIKAAKEDNYNCSTCHMPSAPNQNELATGKAKPNQYDQRDKDGVSCFYCHQIAYVKKAHLKNQIILTRQVSGYKPTIYGSLKNPEESDKHTMTHSPIYEKYVCFGCHSHKRNSHDVLIFDAMGDKQDSKGCIKCHMPLVNGKVEKMNQKARLKHHDHSFAGIHDQTMRKKGLSLKIKVKNNTLHVKIKNKLPHPLIMQAARVKYLKIVIKSRGKIIWKNFKKSPLENKKGVFEVNFLGIEGKPVIIPAYAYKRGYVNNIGPKKSKTIDYKIPNIHKGDIITASIYILLAKPNCQKLLKLEDPTLKKPLLLKSTKYIVKGKK